MNDSSETLEIILKCASIPSFSSYEDRLHPYLKELAAKVQGAEMLRIPHNNLLIKIPGRNDCKPVALAAHLDKINHYGESHPDVLETSRYENSVEGLLDDSAGLGICLNMMLRSTRQAFPPLYLFLSEMEESYGIRNHPGLLKENGQGRYHGMGAERIAMYVLEKEIAPELVLTVDTTPLFKGEAGVALYAHHWELNEIEPSLLMIQSTMNVVRELTSIDTGLKLSNNTNDYLVYGRFFNRDQSKPVPSLALEPAIFPYHEKNERIFVDDIRRVESVLSAFLEQRAK